VKKRLPQGFAVLAFAAGLAGWSFGATDLRFGFSLSGGLSRIDGGDFNRAIRDRNAWVADSNDYENENLYAIDWKEMSWLPKIGGEINLRIGRYFGIGAGAEYIRRTNPGTIEHGTTTSSTFWYGVYYYKLNEEIYDATVTISQTLTVVPLTLSLYGFLPLGPGVEAYVKLGGGVYLGKLTSDWALASTTIANENYYWSSGTPFPPHYHVRIDGTEEESWEATSTAWGLHFGAGFCFNLSRGIALFGETFYRLVNFAEWKGSGGWDVEYDQSWGYTDSTEPVNLPESDSFSVSGSTSGKLWFYEMIANELETGVYGEYGLYENKPQEGYFIKNARPAEINLNGFTFKVGIRIFFGVGGGIR